MSSHDPTVDDPIPREAVAWVVSELRADSTLQGLFDVGSESEAETVMFQGRQKVATEAGEGLPERFLVGRELVEAGGRVQSFSGLDPVKVQVMSECRKSVPSLEQWHEDVHDRVFELLVGRLPEVGTGAAEEPFRRVRKPARPMWDDNASTFHATSTFQVTLRP